MLWNKIKFTDYLLWAVIPGSVTGQMNPAQSTWEVQGGFSNQDEKRLAACFLNWNLPIFVTWEPMQNFKSL